MNHTLGQYRMRIRSSLGAPEQRCIFSELQAGVDTTEKIHWWSYFSSYIVVLCPLACCLKYQIIICRPVLIPGLNVWICILCCLILKHVFCLLLAPLPVSSRFCDGLIVFTCALFIYVFKPCHRCLSNPRVQAVLRALFSCCVRPACDLEVGFCLNSLRIS